MLLSLPPTFFVLYVMSSHGHGQFFFQILCQFSTFFLDFLSIHRKLEYMCGNVSLATLCHDLSLFGGKGFYYYSLLLTVPTRKGNASCHKPVDPNLWWLATQARVYRYVSAGPEHRGTLHCTPRLGTAHLPVTQALLYASGTYPGNIQSHKETWWQDMVTVYEVNFLPWAQIGDTLRVPCFHAWSFASQHSTPSANCLWLTSHALSAASSQAEVVGCIV